MSMDRVIFDEAAADRWKDFHLRDETLWRALAEIVTELGENGFAVNARSYVVEGVGVANISSTPVNGRDEDGVVVWQSNDDGTATVLYVGQK
ncbi:hypothetical protein ACUXNS_002528 [Brevibacterium pityocampae]